jgi:hypothetical protein
MQIKRTKVLTGISILNITAIAIIIMLIFMQQTAKAYNESGKNTDQKYNTVKNTATELKKVFERIDREPVNLRARKKAATLKKNTGQPGTIKTSRSLKEASDVEPSAALKTILRAIQNGTFSLQESQKEDYRVWSDPFTKEYTSEEQRNIYDITVLDSEDDIFLSLGYEPLTVDSLADDIRSQRIEDLISVIEVIDRTAETNSTKSPGVAELDRKKAQLRAYTERPRQHSKSILEFLGIEKDRPGGNYEELTQSYRRYKAWTERMEKLDNYLKTKRRRKILNTPKTPKSLNYRQPELEKISR